MFEGCSLDLPHDIAAGEYRLVSSAGLVKSIRITLDDLVYHGLPIDAPPRDVYTLVAGNQRWHFIRVDSETSPAPAPLVAEKTESTETPAREFLCQAIESILIARVRVRQAAFDLRSDGWRKMATKSTSRLVGAARTIVDATVSAVVDSLHSGKWAERVSGAADERPEF